MKGYSVGKKAVVIIPFIWLILFLFLPFLYLLKISLADAVVASPPFTALTQIQDGVLRITLDFKHYAFAATHSGFLWAFLSSIKLAFITTCLCILVGYPMAYAIARIKSKWRTILLISIILPYWTSFLIRAYAWINLLQNNGIVNQTLIKTGVIQFPLHLLYSNFAVYIGLLYGYLPYFVLPLYATLVKLDYSLQEAALDLGARPLRAFWSVIWPLSIPGVLVGALLVFIPAVGEVVIPQILGGLQTLMIGNIIWQEFFIANNWCLAAALALIMLVILIFPIIWLLRIQSRMETR
jgi:putrescine transport system permease protein